MLHWLWHALAWTWGGDGWGGGNSPGYLVFSGPFADLTVFTAAAAFYWRHTCHVTGCWRVARHPVQGTTYTCCRKHHPHEHVTAERVVREHEARTR